MDTQSNKQITYFLFELIVNCLLFVISAAICISLFVEGYVDSEDSNALSIAMIEASNAAEVAKSSDGNLDLIADTYQDGEIADQSYIMYYDDSWHSVASEESYKYSLVIDLGASTDSMMDAHIYLKQTDGKIIYELNISHFIPV